jgi:hypothetical protein
MSIMKRARRQAPLNFSGGKRAQRAYPPVFVKDLCAAGAFNPGRKGSRFPSAFPGAIRIAGSFRTCPGAGVYGPCLCHLFQNSGNRRGAKSAAGHLSDSRNYSSALEISRTLRSRSESSFSRQSGGRLPENLCWVILYCTLRYCLLSLINARSRFSDVICDLLC